VGHPFVNGDGYADPAIFVPDDSNPIRSVRAVIACSERAGREKLRSLLNAEPGLEVLAECHDREQTTAAINLLQPDLVVVDVELRGIDGFQILNAIPSGRKLVVIFVSPDQKDAVRTFEAHALDSSLKPFDQDWLRWAILRTRLELPKNDSEGMNLQVREDSSDIPLRPAGALAQPNNRLLIKAKGRIVFLNQHEISWIEAASNYVRVRACGEWYVFRGSISRTMARLDPNYFIRIHRSTIVNLRKIKELIPVNGSEYVVVLKCGKELSCGRGHRAALQRLLHQYL
jgi:two-component system, LytTR family, response regulator